MVDDAKVREILQLAHTFLGQSSDDQLDLTVAEHWLLVGSTQLFSGLVVLGVTMATGEWHEPWWIYLIPNSLTLVVSVFLPALARTGFWRPRA